MFSLQVLISLYLSHPLATSGGPQYKMWGPGLRPDLVVLPCRYFFVDILNTSDGDSKDTISVTIEGVTNDNRICRPHTEVFTRSVGFLVRYKLFYDCNNIEIAVKVNGDHISNSPVRMDTVSHADSCDCPKNSLENWVVENNCPAAPKQMETDLNKFLDEGVDMRIALVKAKSTFSHRGTQCWCHYAVKDGEIYRQCFGQHVGFNMFWDNVLQWLARRAVLPDVEMLVNLGDWPLVSPTHSSIPMFSWCGSTNTLDMLFPTYELTEASLECMGRQSLDVLSALGRNQVPWDQKIEKLFWRGRDSRRERLELVELGKKYPHLINASITAYFFFREEEARLGKSPYVSFFDFFDYKYQLNIDGTVAAYRLPYLLAGTGVVFKQESPYYEHFYSDLLPWVHYIPVDQDLSNLITRIEWAREHDQEARQISENAQKFAEEHLMPLNILCYHAQLISRWAGLIQNTVDIGEGLEKLENTKIDGRFGACKCEAKSEKISLKDEL